MAVTIQLRGDTAANWASANPILAVREMAIETDTDLYKVGDGATAWNALPYKALRQVDNATVLNFADQAIPANPAANTLNVFAKKLSGRMMLRMQGPSGLITPLQPSFYSNNIYVFLAGSGTTVFTLGDTLTAVGTVSHPTVTELYGRMVNQVTGGAAGNTSGTGTASLNFLRGSVPGSNGFFFNGRCAFPDASYNEAGASTGSRIFVGLTDQTMAVSVGANDPAGNRVGFQRLHVNGSTLDTNWFITVKDGTTQARVDTGIAFTPQKVYDFYLFCQPQGTEIFWRIDNVTAGTTAEGSVTSQIPLNTAYMRAGLQVQSVNAVTRNIRWQRIYVESDR